MTPLITLTSGSDMHQSLQERKRIWFEWTANRPLKYVSGFLAYEAITRYAFCGLIGVWISGESKRQAESSIFCKRGEIQTPSK